MQEQLKCKRLGCNQKYIESENGLEACKYHPGKPIFHDLKKGWTCCNKIVFDWDEFQKLEACAVGCHDATESKGNNDQSQFFQSNTVEIARKGLEKFADAPKESPISIADFNREQEAKRRDKEIEDAKIIKKTFLTPKGLFKCVNKGCMKEYDPNDPLTQAEDACKFHPGNAGFHDLKKFWTCCKVEKYDWDEFMAIKTCAVGTHAPKMV